MLRAHSPTISLRRHASFQCRLSYVQARQHSAACPCNTGAWLAATMVLCYMSKQADSDLRLWNRSALGCNPFFIYPYSCAVKDSHCLDCEQSVICGCRDMPLVAAASHRALCITSRLTGARIAQFVCIHQWPHPRPVNSVVRPL